MITFSGSIVKHCTHCSITNDIRKRSRAVFSLHTKVITKKLRWIRLLADGFSVCFLLLSLVQHANWKHSEAKQIVAQFENAIHSTQTLLSPFQSFEQEQEKKEQKKEFVFFLKWFLLHVVDFESNKLNHSPVFLTFVCKSIDNKIVEICLQIGNQKIRNEF